MLPWTNSAETPPLSQGNRTEEKAVNHTISNTVVCCLCACLMSVCVRACVRVNASAIVKCSAFPHCAVNWCYTNPLAYYYLKTLCGCMGVCVCGGGGG